jgi:hypothetical protein
MSRDANMHLEYSKYMTDDYGRAAGIRCGWIAGMRPARSFRARPHPVGSSHVRRD